MLFRNRVLLTNFRKRNFFALLMLRVGLLRQIGKINAIPLLNLSHRNVDFIANLVFWKTMHV